jgi:hypothetical protein
MKSYLLIRKFLPKLQVLDHIQPNCIIASDLETELQKASVIYGKLTVGNDPVKYPIDLGVLNHRDTTSYGLLIGYQGIEEEPVTKIDLTQELVSIAVNTKDVDTSNEITKILKRISKQESIK